MNQTSSFPYFYVAEAKAEKKEESDLQYLLLLLFCSSHRRKLMRSCFLRIMDQEGKEGGEGLVNFQ